MTIFLSSFLVLLVSVTVQAATLTLLWEPVATTTDSSAGVPDKYTVYRSVDSDPLIKIADVY
jgi:hypothetical protein